MRFALTAIVAGFLFPTPNHAEVFSNVLGQADFPGGAVSFADELIAYSPGIVFDPSNNADVPLPAYRDPNNTLGVPDVDVQAVIDCGAAPGTDTCKFASLGVGGELTVRFTDNLLTGSGSADPDLWVFVAGPPEATFVDLSTDGINWLSAGLWPSFAIGVDIDAFGFGIDDAFSYVRLRDDPDSGNTTGITVGGDIDAIGAISTTIVPLPASAWLLVSALGAMTALRRRKRDAG